jgi:hypothetical protein
MKKKLEKPVLADGEVTGHAHVLDSSVDVFELDNGLREFSLETPATIKHEEHKPIVLPEGDYVSGKVLEYDHFAEEARVVRD